MTLSITKQMKWVIGAVAASFFTMTADASTIFSDNFSTGLANWDGGINISGQITPDVVTGTFCGGIAGNTCLDMDGSGTSSNANITTIGSYNLAAGDYTFSFNWGNNIGTTSLAGDNILNWSIFVGAGTLSSGSVNSGSSAISAYTLDSTTFTLASAVTGAKIRMWQTGDESDDGGTILDDVLLTLDAAATVPEPGTVALLGLGLLGMVVNGRKTRRV